MPTKKDIEKMQDNISPEISCGTPQLIARSQKNSSIISQQEAEILLDLKVDKRT